MTYRLINRTNNSFIFYRCTKAVLVLCLLLGGSLSSQAGFAEALEAYQQRWADAMYQAEQEKREPLLTELADQLRSAVATHSDSAPLLIWQGIVLSTLAGERGGLGALGLVKEAKVVFEAALALDPGALGGSAATSLGSLYHQVPGWPIGFGNDKKALRYLEQGLAENPQGIDANYFMGQYWIEKNRAEIGKQYLLVAQLASPREGRGVADAGRQTEIQALLQTLVD